MSGHSKWSNIKHKKEKTDAQRGKIFTKIGREIAIAVKEGGSDPDNNSKLRDVIAKAKANNMPGDTILRSIKKAAGELGNVNYEEVIYEGYAPGGVALIVRAVTDNRNRTAGEMRYIFDKAGGSLAGAGCVSWMFERMGVIVIERTPETDEDEIMMEALEAGATDVVASDDYFEVTTEPAEFSGVRERFEALGLGLVSAGITLVPQTTVPVPEEAADALNAIIEGLEDNDDVQEVTSNAQAED
jgi:YebC/PmpR family DNA-binding regulatory protein